MPEWRRHSHLWGVTPKELQVPFLDHTSFPKGHTPTSSLESSILLLALWVWSWEENVMVPWWDHFSESPLLIWHLFPTLYVFVISNVETFWFNNQNSNPSRSSCRLSVPRLTIDVAGACDCGIFLGCHSLNQLHLLGSPSARTSVPPSQFSYISDTFCMW